MNYGMNISASGVLSSMYRMDVLSNNLANIGTVGFKPDAPALRQRDAVRAEDNVWSLPSSALLERLGAGVTPVANVTSFTQGTISTTGNPMDVAIRGEGFFVMLDSSGSGADRFRLTRDGRFTRDRQGRMVSATTGMPVVDVSNRPIVIPSEGEISIDADGTIRQRGQTLAQLQLTSIPDTTRLTKVGNGMFRTTSEAWSSRSPGKGLITQNAVEESAIDPVTLMMRITDAGRAAESNMSLVQNHSQMMERAINTLGRFQA